MVAPWEKFFMAIYQMVVEIYPSLDQRGRPASTDLAIPCSHAWQSSPSLIQLQLYSPTLSIFPFQTGLPWVWAIRCRMDLAQSLYGLWLCHRTVSCTIGRPPASDCLCYWSSLTHWWLHLWNSRQTRGFNKGQANYFIPFYRRLVESSSCQQYDGPSLSGGCGFWFVRG